jgi:hypothetical protein
LTDTSLPGSPPPARPARRILRVVARGLGALLVLLIAALSLVLHDLDGRVRSALVVQGADLERAIGRAVTIGAVHVAMGRTAEIVVSDVVIAGAAGGTGPLSEPLLRVPTIRLGVRLAPLVRSWGSSIEVTRFEVEGPEITVVRTAEGLSTDDVRARVAALPARPPPTSRSRIALDHLAITAAKLHLRAVDGAPGGDLDVDPITLDGADVRPDAASHLALRAAMAPGATLDVGLDFAVSEGDPPGGAASLAKVAIHGAGVRLAPILAWLRARPTPAFDLADAAVGLDVVVAPGPLTLVVGKATIARARFAATSAAGERTLGAPVDLSLELDAMVSPERGSLLARSFDLAIGDVHARGAAELHGLDGAPRIDLAQLDATGDAEAILAMLPAGARPRRVSIAGPVALSLRGGHGVDFAHCTVKLELHEARLVDVDAAGQEHAGAPARIGLDADLFLRESTGALHASSVELRVGDSVVRGEARAHDLATDPVLDELRLSLVGLAPQLLDLAPPSRRRADVAVRGPFWATVSAHGKPGDIAGQITVDLGSASVRTPGLQKPANVRFGLDLEGRVAAVSELTRGSIGLGPLALTASGRVWSSAQFDIAFAWKEAALAPLLALLPDASARLAGGTISGNLGGSGTIQRGGGKTEVATKLSLRSALLRRGPLALLGASEATASVVTTGDKVSARITADLGAATLAVSPVFSKPAGRPAHLAFAVARDGDHVSVLDAQLALPGATIDGLAVDVEPHRAHVTVAAATIALGPLAEMMPLLGAVVPPKLAGATARFNLDFSGDPDALASATLHVGGLSIEGAPGRVAGSVDVDGLRPTRAIRVQITDGALDLAGLGLDLGAGDGGEAPTLDASSALSISGSVHLDSVRARGVTLRPVDAQLGVEHGRLTVKSLHAGAFGGSFDVEKSWLDLGGSAPELDLHARIDAVDLAQVGASPAAELRGRASGQIDLHGADLDLATRDAVTRSLRGSVRIALRDVHARHAFTRKVTVVNPILGAIFAHAASKSAGATRQIDLREVSARFDVGSSGLTTAEPLLVRSDDLTASVRGTLGFDQSLALDGQLSLAVRAIAAATDGKLVPLRPIPLQLRVVGGPSALSLEILELADSVLALRGAVMNGLLGGGIAAPLP